MGEAVKAVFTAPIGNLFILVGLVFLGIAVVGKISGKIEPGAAGRIASGAIGGVLLVAGLAMHAGLIPSSLSPVNPAKILSFEAQPPAVAVGQQAQLCYGVTDARQVRIQPEVPQVKSTEKDCVPIAPRQTTTYTLTATGPDGQSVSRQVTVGVAAAPLPRRAAKIVDFRADPPTLRPGGQSSLCYVVAEARQVRIDPEVGEVKPVEKACVPVAPRRPTTYALTAMGPDGRPVSRQVTVGVEAPARPTRVLHFTAQPPTVTAGQQARLCYGLADARQARIEPGLGEVQPVGSNCVPIAPSQTTTYTLTATGADGPPVSARARVDVTGPTPPALRNEIRNFSAAPVSPSQMQVTVDYTYSGDRGTSNIFMAAYALQSDGTQVPGTGYVPAPLNRGTGRATVHVRMASRNRTHASRIVKVCMYVGGREQFYCQTFPYFMSWRP